MIPKTIHYCWFGGNPLPELAQKCIASWKKYCPDYEIIEWNESNFDIQSCAYASEAATAKKWAFVSDYARFKIIYDHGGVYFDTDVELLKPLNEILDKGGFMAIESYPTSKQPERNFGVAPGLGLAAVAGDPLYLDLIDKYHALHFLNEDGSQNQKTIVEYTTEYLKTRGLVEENCIQCIAGNYIYPKEYFCPMDDIEGTIEITDKTYSIHHYSASWLSDEEKMQVRVARNLSKYLPTGTARHLARFLATKHYRGINTAIREMAAWVKKKIVKKK